MYLSIFNSELNRFIIRTILFCLLIGSIGYLLNFYRARYNAEPIHYKYHFDEIYHPKFKANSIVIGTSHASNSVMPDLLSSEQHRFFNFALNGSNPSYDLNWYEKVFQPNYPKVELCLMEYNWLLFDTSWLNRKFIQDAEYYSSKLFRQLLFVGSKSDGIDLIMNRYPILKYRKGFKNLENLILSNRGNDLFPDESYQHGYISYNIQRDSVHWSPLSLNNKINYRQIEAFDKLLDILQHDGIQTILFMPPEYGILLEDYLKMGALKSIDSVARVHQVVQLNYNTVLRSSFNQDSSNFVDWGHLSSAGAKIFSEKLKRDVDSLMQGIK